MEITSDRKETYTVKFNRKDLIRYFIGEAPKKLHIPNGATNVQLFVDIPADRGGNLIQNVDSECPLVLQYDIQLPLTRG